VLGEDLKAPARNLLNTVTAANRGWKSARFCSYPQELIL